jgi:hypothetical protein
MKNPGQNELTGASVSNKSLKGMGTQAATQNLCRM